MQITLHQACDLLRQSDNIVILSHQKPDGDTLGSAFAMLYALTAMGKTARVDSVDGVPERYAFLCPGYEPLQFQEDFVMAVDVADLQLLGANRAKYEGRIDLCIDHHQSNQMYARASLVDAGAASASQIVYDVLDRLGAKIDKPIANCIFTGLATDTGCFMYDNVTAHTHRVAAALIDAGADHGRINKLMFDTKSRGRMEIDKIMMDSLEYHFHDKCALVYIPNCVLDTLGVSEEELDGVSAFPRKIEGIVAGVTIRERGDGAFRVSVRSCDGVDASRICMELGGGGHRNAAGCTVEGSLEQAKQRILAAVEDELRRVAV